VPLIEKETHRLAVVNMDWSQVKVNFLPFEFRFSELCTKIFAFNLNKL